MRPMRHVLHNLSFTTCLALACVPSQEAARVQLPLAVDGSALEGAPTDLGYTVRLDTARIALRDLELTILGEMHARAARPRPFRLWDLLVPDAWAHPGHYAGGDVTGELPGDFVADWIAGDGAELGVAELLVGSYHGFNFTFRAADELPASDPLKGHTAHFAGVASKDGLDIAFTAVLDLEAGARLIGAPFVADIDEGAAATLRLQLAARDEATGVSLFDGLDFIALDGDGDGAVQIVPGDDAHNVARRALQSHVFYAIALDPD